MMDFLYIAVFCASGLGLFFAGLAMGYQGGKYDGIAETWKAAHSTDDDLGRVVDRRA